MTGSALPRVSVVIPAYNNASTIAETVGSVLAQEGVELDVTIADHSSTDDTVALLEPFANDPRVRLLSTEAGGGAERNWNRVTREASADFVKLVCGDDVLRAGALARQARLLERGDGVLTASRRDIVDAAGKTVMAGWGLSGLTRPMPGAQAIRATVRAGRNLLGEPASVMMRRDDLDEVGGWTNEFPYLIDLATYAKVLLRGTFVPDTAVGATFRMSDSQWSVELVNKQSSQAQGFHNWMHRNHPDVVSETDRRIGNAKAALMARARQVSYRVLKRRMS